MGRMRIFFIGVLAAGLQGDGFHRELVSGMRAAQVGCVGQRHLVHRHGGAYAAALPLLPTALPSAFAWYRYWWRINCNSRRRYSPLSAVRTPVSIDHVDADRAATLALLAGFGGTALASCSSAFFGFRRLASCFGLLRFWRIWFCFLPVDAVFRCRTVLRLAALGACHRLGDGFTVLRLDGHIALRLQVMVDHGFRVAVDKATLRRRRPLSLRLPPSAVVVMVSYRRPQQSHHPEPGSTQVRRHKRSNPNASVLRS